MANYQTLRFRPGKNLMTMECVQTIQAARLLNNNSKKGNDLMWILKNMFLFMWKYISGVLYFWQNIPKQFCVFDKYNPKPLFSFFIFEKMTSRNCRGILWKRFTIESYRRCFASYKWRDSWNYRKINACTSRNCTWKDEFETYKIILIQHLNGMCPYTYIFFVNLTPATTVWSVILYIAFY